MLIQVVHCHPLTDSYGHALYKTVVAALEKSGHQVVATDLYREGFDPVMREDERRGYYQAPYPGDAVAAYTAELRRAEASCSAFRRGGSRCRLC
jgi:NAD(P)H dehydrogenase (quinone)